MDKLPPIKGIEREPVGAIASLAAEPIETIEPSEQLTLDKVWGPDGRVNYSGSSDMSINWVDDQPHLLQRRWNNRPVWVDAATGAMGSVDEPEADPTERVAEPPSEGWSRSTAVARAGWLGELAAIRPECNTYWSTRTTSC
ncbi:MAG: hypothetical protein R3B96_23115 [Pirellulaceae bacterium]